MDLDVLSGHLPIRFLMAASGPSIQWCYVGDERFREPFWDHDIERLLDRPANLFFQPQTPIGTLAQFAKAVNAPTPSGFIFHMSRCGSTLITQMYRTLPRNITLSEPSVIDTVLRIRSRFPAVTKEQQADWLRWLIAAIGYPRPAAERDLFVKFDCWHVLHLPVLRRAFPTVPFIFLYRDPVEVMVSQVNRRGAQMMPQFVQAENYGMTTDEAVSFTPEEYCARVLAVICRAALDYHRQDPMLLVEYKQLPEVAWGDLARYLNLRFELSEIETMRDNARSNAKVPDVPFRPDSTEKRRAASPEIIKEVEERLTPLYAELENARAAQSWPRTQTLK